MFLYEPLSLAQACMWIIVFMALVGANEFSRLNKWTGALCFIALPLFLTVVVWPKSVPGTSVDDWFHYAKVYSCLAGCVGFWAIRYIKGLADKKWALFFPPLILAINILEACVRDFQVFTFGATGQLIDGVYMMSGPWNIMNGIAGLLNIVTITGWLTITLGKGKSRDMLWPDMIFPWIIAYDLWNYAYTYNCLSSHSFYCGLALLLSCTFAAFFIKKGAWLQHRAHTLAFWCMFAQTLPAFIDEGTFAVKASMNPQAFFVVSLLALVVNLGVFIYQLYRMRQLKKAHTLDGQPIYTNWKAYQEVMREEVDKESRFVCRSCR